MNTTQLIAVLSPVLTAVSIDLTGYYTELSKDPNAPFRWRLFLVRVAIGATAGLGSLIGVNAAA